MKKVSGLERELFRSSIVRETKNKGKTMPAYLKIENPGVAPTEAFTLLGASTKRESDNAGTIGQFGSGNKHGVAVLLRHDMSPIVFAGNLKLEFTTRTQNVDDGLRSTGFNRVQVKYGGKDADGKNRSSTEDLGFVLEYGASDWGSVELALREFVSNSIDRAVEEGEAACVHKWDSDPLASESLGETLKRYRKTARDFKNVVVEIVGENQVRAKAGHTRVFIPLTSEVTEFYNNLGKWFLHFSEPENLNVQILPKKNRNIGGRKAAVIYRRGVRVREFESSEVPSLFDYNLPNLVMDEARKVDDWRVRQAAGTALIDASSDVIAKVMQSFVTGDSCWEHEFDGYSLEPYNDTVEKLEARQKVWGEVFDKVAGITGVLSTAEGGEQAARKGYKVVTAPKAFVKAASRYGVRTPEQVLTLDDREGRQIVDAKPDAVAAINFVWHVIEQHGMTNGKTKPSVKCFNKVMEGGAQTLGFYRNGVTYLSTDIAGNAVAEGCSVAGLSQQLLVTALEEVAHHTTGSTDNSRDFQDYVLNLAMKCALAAGGASIHAPIKM